MEKVWAFTVAAFDGVVLWQTGIALKTALVAGQIINYAFQNILE